MGGCIPPRQQSFTGQGKNKQKTTPNQSNKNQPITFPPTNSFPNSQRAEGQWSAFMCFPPLNSSCLSKETVSCTLCAVHCSNQCERVGIKVSGIICSQIRDFLFRAYHQLTWPNESNYWAFRAKFASKIKASQLPMPQCWTPAKPLMETGSAAHIRMWEVTDSSNVCSCTGETKTFPMAVSSSNFLGSILISSVIPVINHKLGSPVVSVLCLGHYLAELKPASSI